MSARTAELTEDSKLVYNGTVIDLVALAEKYNVTTSSLTFAKKYPNPVYASIGVQAFASKSTRKEMQSKLYATIKQELSIIASNARDYTERKFHHGPIETD